MTAIEFGSPAPGRAVSQGLPGPSSAAALDALELDALSDDELVDAMTAWRRLTSWAQANELTVVAEFVRRREAQHPDAPNVKLAEFIADEIAATLTLSGGAAGMWAGLACKLSERLALTREALIEGRVDLGRARVIADGLLGVEPDTARLVEERVIGEAEVRPAGRLRHRVHEGIKAVDPQAAEERRRRARKVRSLERWATAAGTCELVFREMAEDDAEAIYNKINAVAHAMRADGDARPIDAIRHDLGVALLRGSPLPHAARDLRAPEVTGPHTCDCADEDLDQQTGECTDRCPGRHTGEQPSRHAEGEAGLTSGRPGRSTGERTSPGPGREAAGRPREQTDQSGKRLGHPDASRADARAGPGDRGRPLEPSARAGGDANERQPGCPRHGISRAYERGAGRDRGDQDDGSRDAEDHQAEDHQAAVTAAAAQVGDLLTKIIDGRLSSETEGHRASGRRGGMALRVTAALRTLSSALSESKERWCEMTTEPTPADATSVPHGHHGYRAPAAMRRLVERTHQVCVFPACSRPAAQCDLDHTVAWHRGGPTCPCNLSPLCRRHHRLKQHPRWHLFQPWPGLLVWVTPAGKWHTVIPENRW